MRIIFGVPDPDVDPYHDDRDPETKKPKLKNQKEKNIFLLKTNSHYVST